MRAGRTILRLGALSLALYLLAAFEVRIEGRTIQSLFGDAILFGFPPLMGVLLLANRGEGFGSGTRGLMYLTHGIALVAILWLILWCFVWLAMMAALDQPVMTIKHTAYLHLFGVGFAMAGYARGWMTAHLGGRSAMFSLGAGWAVSYMALFNLYFQPSLRELWWVVLGGFLVVIGAFLMERSLKRPVEAR